MARRQAVRPNKRNNASRRRSPEDMLIELKARLREISDFGAAGAVLSWDQATYMPEGGAQARGRQLAGLSRYAHELSVAPELGRLIDGLTSYGESLPPDGDEACLIRVARRDFTKASKVPPDYTARASAHGAASYQAWTRARPANDFAAMVPFLEKTLALSREYSGFFAPYAHIADPHIDDADEGMTAASVNKLFSELKRRLMPLVRAICDQPPADDSCLRQNFAETPQVDFSRRAAARIGYDFSRGRIDLTHHPFCTKFSAGDVRITTRVNPGDLGDALFSTLHEAGHAMYEQGIAAALEGAPLGHGVSAGVHESQSRLWENIVARSVPFWNYFYQPLQRAFPQQLGRVPLAAFQRAINKVARSLIRTDADEVTYNFHIMLRFTLELDLLGGRLRVKDLPEAWRAAMQADLGIAPADDRDGCLQDVHWYSGTIGGGFQSYAVGNILAAQFYVAALNAHPHIPDDMANGEFATLRSWLTANVYRHGSKFTPDELVRRATGSGLRLEPYLSYLTDKYGALYRLPAGIA